MVRDSYASELHVHHKQQKQTLVAIVLQIYVNQGTSGGSVCLLTKGLIKMSK